MLFDCGKIFSSGTGIPEKTLKSAINKDLGLFRPYRRRTIFTEHSPSNPLLHWISGYKPLQSASLLHLSN